MSEPSKKYGPYIMEVEAKSYAWCTCSESTKQPFCDGSHGKVGMSPKIIQFTEKKKVAWCMCKATSSPPFCDGSHKHIHD